MVISEITGVKITGLAAAVSNTWTPLTAFEGEEDAATIQKFIKKTGVQGRYDAGVKQTTADFCCAAAKKVLEEKGVAPKDIGVLVFVTQTQDYRVPATACVLQYRLGLSKDCIAFDVNLGCSGFTYGVNIAASLLKTSNAGKALLLCGDTAAKEKSPRKKSKTSRSTTLLMGDSGTAALLEKCDDSKPLHMISKTDGSGFRAIIAPYERWRNPDPPPPPRGVSATRP